MEVKLCGVLGGLDGDRHDVIIEVEASYEMPHIFTSKLSSVTSQLDLNLDHYRLLKDTISLGDNGEEYIVEII